ncbi:fibrinogen-like protein A [Pomacea canaliculata]|uniref:fibrinogen-like protein A n=1 Tax=Pomacea canaliculata TaxID=400727 RepID=UPI000D736B73|nr:fibrinogen-like protein A [Pomacea canaliculata]
MFCIMFSNVSVSLPSVPASGGLCRLHDVTAHESPSYWAPKTSKGWTHYQKSCKSTFASHDTWYNLLCNSKIDCPDPYSDCLKGRCQCPLVFKIWTVCLSRRYCVDWHTAGAIKSGVYTVELGHKGLRPVWCDMDTEFGGWMVIYRRRDGSVDFHRNWADYENGFGNISGDFWLGLDAIYDMTGTGYSRLRVELVATAGPLHLAYYDYFSVSGPEEDYKLYAGGYSGDAGDVFAASHGHPFHTYDHSKYGCATPYIGAWWYPPDCQIGFEPNANFKHLMSWPGIGYVAYAEMKMKPRWG